ncbi:MULTISPECIES: WXG100 family type VII secretion target [Mycolicibacterium]|uniref:ESAT-6-like protein n=1 Tax=Mycolicibacterium wolinskyi TaxID=59750 RepID=A0A132PMH0_9MYCO|nr:MULTISPECIES: WXG100 family type VII secretion target [Mycolicibacterium]KWX23515.1 hypothetical protein AFM11_14695 [Mycolicibacterium wolinskyi]MCV7290837.1 WXG100 family type VII secretion target [Mycolicibacterium wolinskyi]MCV7291110.1 WXG100 family type VII secretion target [Mycolicibacterium goodii]ORX17250.1 hypothetical protein AWC31_18205 [Mycolicibacterium wolinskyi]
MVVALTPQEAAAKITQIDEAMGRARSLVAKMQGETETMVSGPWNGVAAGKFNELKTGQHDEYNLLIQTLTNVAEKGKKHIQSIATADQA